MIQQLNLSSFTGYRNTSHLMQGTSLYAYNDILDSLGERQSKVLKVIIKQGPISNREIMQELNLPINCITGRTRELVKAGYVEKKTTTLNENGRPEILWGVLK